VGATIDSERRENAFAARISQPGVSPSFSGGNDFAAAAKRNSE
jgi:hypothetical protein